MCRKPQGHSLTCICNCMCVCVYVLYTKVHILGRVGTRVRSCCHTKLLSLWSSRACVFVCLFCCAPRTRAHAIYLHFTYPTCAHMIMFIFPCINRQWCRCSSCWYGCIHQVSMTVSAAHAICVSKPISCHENERKVRVLCGHIPQI